MRNNRRDFLKAAGTALVAASVPVAAVAQLGKDDDAENGFQSNPVYLNGCGWNRDLPGVFGQACYAFEMRAELGGTGVGTIRDDVHPEINSQFRVFQAGRANRNQYSFLGEIIASQTPELIGSRVTIAAEPTGPGMGRATLMVESQDENLVVIAIIAVLIGLLLPARQL